MTLNDGLVLIAAVFGSGGGAWIGVKVHLAYLQAGVKSAHRRIDEHLNAHSHQGGGQ